MIVGNLSRARATSRDRFMIGDLLVSFHYIYVITERDEGKENEVPVVMATGFYQWNDGHVEWESTTWAEALMRADLVIM